jgi:FKBP-type peptidyl-prolyl cis-trans isomerase 2
VKGRRMTIAKEGDRVKVKFIGTLEDGTVFGRTHQDEPFEFTLGAQQVLAKFEEAVIGMREGDTKTISIPPEDAYGHYKEDLLFSADKSEIPAHIAPEAGKKIRIQLASGNMAILTVKKVEEDRIIFDGNDPLAGKNLTFEVELLEIVEKAEEAD